MVFAAKSSGSRASAGTIPSERQKPSASFLVVSGRAHRHRHRFAVDSDLERLFDRNAVWLVRAVGDAYHVHG